MRVFLDSIDERVMEALALQGLSMIPEDFRVPIQELEYHRSFAGKNLLEHDDAKPIVKKARRLLYRRMKVGVEDGRLFVGKFHCLDKQGNIILYETVEFRNVDGVVGGVPVEERSLGMVLIPARCRTSCHVECSLDEKLDLLSIGS